MDFKYISFKEDLLAATISSNKAKVYVFNNFNNLKASKKYYQKPFLDQESLFISLEELKEKLFPVNKIVLREEKLGIIFFELMTAEEKEKLKVKSYFDVIDLQVEFNNFFKILNEYNISDIPNLKDWQQEKYELFLKLRERYKQKLAKLGYIDQVLSFNFNNFSLEYLKDYQELVFVNILNFTPKERKLVKKIEESGKKVSFYLQVNQQDYNQDKLQLKKISLTENLVTKLKLYRVEEDLLQLLNLILTIDKDHNYHILDCNFNNSNYDKLLNKNIIQMNKEITFTETKTFKLLDCLFQLLKNSETSKYNFKLEIKDLLAASYLEFFRDYYQLTEYNLACLEELALNDYVYFSPQLSKKGIERYQAVFTDLKELNNLTNLKDFISFLENIKLEKLEDEQYLNSFTIYFNALRELSVIEEMGIVNSWQQYFYKRAEGLFLLILNYLRYKKVKTKEGSDTNTVEIEDLLTASQIKRDKVLILNATSGVIPTVDVELFLLTEKQWADLGVNILETKTLMEKYNFLRHVLTSQQAIIFAEVNLENNITSSSLLEELRLKYNLEIKDAKLKSEHYPQLINNIFSSDLNIFKDKLSIANKKLCQMSVEKNDFSQGSFSLSYYKYQRLKDCYYRLYLQDIVSLHEKKLEFNKGLTTKVFGVFVHDILAEIMTKIKMANFDLEHKLVKEVIMNKFNAYHLKINNYYKRYYQEIVLDKIAESISFFLQELKRKRGNKILRVLTEVKADKEEVFIANDFLKVSLNGRIDLVLEEKSGKYIVDFKTGSAKIEQLDFYALLLAEQQIDKSMYTVLDKKFINTKRGTELEFAEKMTKELEEFINSPIYTREFKLRCKRCLYFDLCKVVQEID